MTTVKHFTIIHEPPAWPTYRHQYVVLEVGTLRGEAGRFNSEREAIDFRNKLNEERVS